MSNHALFNDPDPWAEDHDSKKSIDKTSYNIDPSFINPIVTNSLNLMGNSTTSSMLDSAIDAIDSLNFDSGTSWGNYNSSNILHNQHNNVNQTLKTHSTFTDSTAEDSPFQIDFTKPNDDNDEDIDDDIGDDEVDDLAEFSNSKIWSDADCQKFNPLSNKHALDGIDIKVKEIPEKEGLVFKHINYLISHTINFGNTNTSNDAANKETKIIRRYSDFVWLLEVLWKKYPYRLIPELPPKQFGCMYCFNMNLQQ